MLTQKPHCTRQMFRASREQRSKMVTGKLCEAIFPLWWGGDGFLKTYQYGAEYLWYAWLQWEQGLLRRTEGNLDENCSFSRDSIIWIPAFTPGFCQPPGKYSCTSQRCEITFQRCCCPRLPGKFQLIHTHSTKVWNWGTQSSVKHASPPESRGDLLPTLLQAPPSPHVHLLSYIPNPKDFGHSGAGLASGAGSAAAAGVTQAPF